MVDKGYYLLLGLMMLVTACEQQVKRPVVMAVYPSSEFVPENLLRIYVQFSGPMKTLGNLEKIKLFDEGGHEVPHVFFNNVYELWNKEQTQLTLILDPARVKTGLKINSEMGRAIRPNKRYTLVVAGLEDVHHQEMAAPFKKKLTVTEADLQIPDTKKWKLSIPKPDSREALKVTFRQMLDYNSLQQRLVVTDSDNNPLKGTITIEKQETEWTFRPSMPWREGSYVLYVNSRLEDPAGNNLNGLFDHKVGSLKYGSEGEMEKIAFKIK